MPSLSAAAAVRSAPMAPMLRRLIFAAASGLSSPEKLVAANADTRPILSACAINAATRVVGSPQACPQTIWSPGRT
jgi:hypothetical protein